MAGRQQVFLEYFTKIKVRVQSQRFLAGLAYLFMHAGSTLTVYTVPLRLCSPRWGSIGFNRFKHPRFWHEIM